MLLVINLYLLLPLYLQVISATEQCPTWKWYNYSSNRCECGDDVGGYIRCSEDNGTLLARYDICVSWDSSLKENVMGMCNYKAINNISHRVYLELPQNPDNLSSAQCGPNKREGLFCSRCKQGYAPTLHIFDSMCINCSYCLPSWITLFLYLVTEILPLTLFYLLIICARINVISGPMLGYVIFCQVHITVARVHPNLMKLLLYHAGPFILHWNRDLLLPLAGIWNLNFFAMLLPYTCYGCDFNDLTTILFEYLSLGYIFMLLLLSYLFKRQNIKSKFASIRCCKAIGYYIFSWRQDGRYSDSTMHALATFIGLMLAKAGIISCQILSLTHIYNLNGTVIKQVYTFHPSLERHYVQRIIGIIPLIIFGILPAIVLCLYPNRYFQNAVQCFCGPRKQLALTIFVDTWCSGYRDGLNGGRDYRRLYPLFLITLIALVGITSSFHLKPETYYILLLPIAIVLSFCVSYVRPCKTIAMNMSLSFHFMIIGLCALTLALWVQDFLLDARILEIAFTVFITLPHVFMLLWFIYNIEQHWSFFRNCFMKAKIYFGRSKFLLHRFEP